MAVSSRLWLFYLGYGCFSNEYALTQTETKFKRNNANHFFLNYGVCTSKGTNVAMFTALMLRPPLFLHRSHDW
jgi:hypothetical protein